MIRPTHAIIALSSAAVMSTLAAHASMAQATGNTACALVTEAELQVALGSKVTLKPGSIGNVQTCGGSAQSASVLVRFFKMSKAAKNGPRDSNDVRNSPASMG